MKKITLLLMTLLMLPVAIQANGPRRSATDISGMDYAVYFNPTTVAPGSQAVLTINLKNSVEIVGFQCLITFPEGISVAKDEYNSYMIATSPERIDPTKKTSDCEIQSDGSYKLLAFDAGNRVYSGNDGAVMLITLDVAEDVALGTYDVPLTDIKLSTPASQDIIVEEVICELTVKEAEAIVLDENSTEVPEATDGDQLLLVKRSITKNQWSTICLPFDMTLEQTYEVFGDDVQLQEFVDYETTYDDDDNVIGIQVHFEDIDLNSEGKFYGNFPYLIKTSKDISEFEVTATVDPLEDEAKAEYDNGKTGRQRQVYGSLIGTLHKTVVPENDLFLSGNKFWYSTGATNIKAFRAYFDFVDVLTSVEDASANIQFDFTTTGIREVNDNNKKSNTGVYTIQGQYVGKDLNVNTLQPGIYVVNGEKRVVK